MYEELKPLLKKFGDIVDKYDEYLENNQGNLQLDIHNEINQVLDNIHKILRKHGIIQ